jgi:uncharacterized protein
MRLMIAAMIFLIGLGGAGSVKAESVRAGWDVGVKAYASGDYATALRKWGPLAEQGYSSAQYNLGQMYRMGQGVLQDYKVAVRWYRVAAEQGNSDAQFALGRIYFGGQGVLQDYKEVMRWYRKAAEQGHAVAQSGLGAIYSRGTAVPQDSVLGHMWSNIAGANGNKVGADNRAVIEKIMTPAQITEAQKLAKECMNSNYKNCGR